MTYKIVLKKRAKKFIDQLPQNERRRVVTAIEKLPDGTDIKKLKDIQTIFVCVSVIIESSIQLTMENGLSL